MARAGEVLGFGKEGLRGDAGADDEHGQPDGAHDVAGDADEEVDAARPAQAFGADDAEVLHIALRPAAFAANEVVQRWWQAFVAATKVGVHAHVPARAAQQGGFDEVVAHDVAADGVAPAQDGQAAAFGEGMDADDGVMSPVVAVFALPGGNATGDDGSVEGAGELDGARQQ